MDLIVVQGRSHQGLVVSPLMGLTMPFAFFCFSIELKKYYDNIHLVALPSKS